MQAPEWLPFRLRSTWNDWRVRRAVADVRSTAARPVAAAGADVEVHLLVCRRDALLAVLAVKSLLRFFKVPVAVAFSDDGSLKREDRDLLAAHFPGCRLLPRLLTEGETAAVFRSRPRLADLYRGSYALARKLVHPLAAARSPRVIVVDADTAFFHPPQKLLNWCTKADAAPCYMHDRQDEAAGVPNQVRAAFENLRREIAPPNVAWASPHFFFNSGLLLFRPGQLDLDAAEKFLSWRAQVGRDLTTGRPGIWFGEWTKEQTAYFVMFALARERAEPLGAEYHLGLDPDRCFNHFLRHYLVQAPTLKRLHALVAEL